MESLSPTTYILSLFFLSSLSLSAKKFFTLEEINNPITYVDMGIHFLFWCYLPLHFSFPLFFLSPFFSFPLFLFLSLPLSSDVINNAILIHYFCRIYFMIYSFFLFLFQQTLILIIPSVPQNYMILVRISNLMIFSRFFPDFSITFPHFS